jgi:hypothetical protein
MQELPNLRPAGKIPFTPPFHTASRFPLLRFFLVRNIEHGHIDPNVVLLDIKQVSSIKSLAALSPHIDKKECWIKHDQEDMNAVVKHFQVAENRYWLLFDLWTSV